jgi:hypothetical protein
MADAFSSVWRKIERAKKHTNDLEAEITTFFGTKPYEIETQGNPKTGPGSYRIKGTPKPLPKSVPLIAGDAVHNLRSALDHFACGAVSTVTTKTTFPVWRASPTATADEWRGAVNGKLRDASPRLIQAVTRLKAYETGNGKDIWTVDNLDLIDKHRLLVYIAVAPTTVTIDFGESLRKAVTGREIPSLPLPIRIKWIPVEEGTVLFTTDSPDGLNTEPEFAFDVTFGEPEILKGEPAVPALRRLIDEVEGLLKRLVPLA